MISHKAVCQFITKKKMCKHDFHCSSQALNRTETNLIPRSSQTPDRTENDLFPLQKNNFRGKEDQHQNQQKLNQENHRHADAEGRLSGFMTEKIHGENAPDAAADDGLQEQDRLGRPPFAAAGLLLIPLHRLEGNQIDRGKINQQQNSCIDMEGRELLQNLIQYRHEVRNPFRRK